MQTIWSPDLMNPFFLPKSTPNWKWKWNASVTSSGQSVAVISQFSHSPIRLPFTMMFIFSHLPLCPLSLLSYPITHHFRTYPCILIEARTTRGTHREDLGWRLKWGTSNKSELHHIMFWVTLDTCTVNILLKHQCNCSKTYWQPTKQYILYTFFFLWSCLSQFSFCGYYIRKWITHLHSLKGG